MVDAFERNVALHRESERSPPIQLAGGSVVAVKSSMRRARRVAAARIGLTSLAGE